MDVVGRVSGHATTFACRPLNPSIGFLLIKGLWRIGRVVRILVVISGDRCVTCTFVQVSV